jgi:hypothetical protein
MKEKFTGMFGIETTSSMCGKDSNAEPDVKKKFLEEEIRNTELYLDLLKSLLIKVI